MLDAVEDYLRRACRRVPITFIELIIPFTLERQWMVTIFNSRHMQKVTPREARVRQALNLLREEFDLGDERR